MRESKQTIASGTVKITHCTIKDLGGLQKRSDTTRLITGNGLPAFDLKVGGIILRVVLDRPKHP